MAIPAHSAASRTGTTRILDWLPEGRELPEADWQGRHRAVRLLVWAHVPVLLAFGLWRGFPADHVALEAGLVGLAAAAAGIPRLGRTARSSAAAFGLMSSSAILVHLSGGYIEAHFHFFVMLAVIALYQAWPPFLLAIGYVVVHHGIGGWLDPTAVYNHPGALANPWLWALIHGGFVLAACVASLVTWRFSEGWALKAQDGERRLHSVLDAAPVVLFATDARGVITLAEGQALAGLGLRPQDVVGKGVLEVFPDRADLVVLTQRALAGGVAEATVAVGGRTFDLRFSQLRDAGGKVEGLSGVATDVTERHRAEDRQREVEQLQAQADFKTRFINTAAHELNTPLTPIRTELYMLQRDGGKRSAERQAKSLAMLDRNVKRLAKLVEDVLQSARMQGGQLRLIRAPTDLAPLLEEAVETYAETAATKGLRLELDLAAPGLDLEMDGTRMSQVFTNLLSNAVKFTPPGGWVRVAAGREGGEVVVRVRDSGPGLRPEQLAKLFQPFSQVHDTMAVTTLGTGLGLYICKGIVEQHGGRVWAESEGPGRGSTFAVALPCTEGLAAGGLVRAASRA